MCIKCGVFTQEVVSLMFLQYMPLLQKSKKFNGQKMRQLFKILDLDKRPLFVALLSFVLR